MMLVKAGSTDVTTYFHLRLAADGTDATGLTIANIDLTYVRTLEEPAAKVDAQALADQDTAHTDNFAIEIDATNMPGVYRVDWPDAAFAAGVREVILTVKVATAFTESLRVQLTQVPADVTHWLGTAAATPTNAGVPEVDITHIAGAAVSTSTAQLGVNTVQAGGTAWGSGAITAASIATDAIGAAELADGAITAATFAAGAIDAAALAADAGTEIGTAVWATAARTLTANTNLGIGTPSDLGSGATLAANLVDIEAQTDDIGAAGAGLTAITSKTDNLPSDPADASVIAARFDTLDTSVADLPTNAELATALGTADDAVLSAINDLPTNAELATALGTADDAVLAQVALVKAKTDLIPGTQDGLTFAQTQMLMASVLLGKASGLETTTAVYRSPDDGEDRVTATVDADGNRSAVTLNTA